MLLSLLFRRRPYTHTRVYIDSGCVWVCVSEFWWLSLQDCFFCGFFCFYFFLLLIFLCLPLISLDAFNLLIGHGKHFSAFAVFVLSMFLLNLLRCSSALSVFVVAALRCCCLLLPVCIPDVRDGHSQELLLLVNVNEMSNVLQSPRAKWPHDIFKLESTRKSKNT